MLLLAVIIIQLSLFHIISDSCALIICNNQYIFDRYN